MTGYERMPWIASVLPRDFAEQCVPLVGHHCASACAAREVHAATIGLADHIFGDDLDCDDSHAGGTKRIARY